MSWIHQKPAKLGLHCFQNFRKFAYTCDYGTDYGCFIIKEIILISKLLIFFFWMDANVLCTFHNMFMMQKYLEVHFKKEILLGLLNYLDKATSIINYI